MGANPGQRASTPVSYTQQQLMVLGEFQSLLYPKFPYLTFTAES